MPLCAFIQTWTQISSWINRAEINYKSWCSCSDWVAELLFIALHMQSLHMVADLPMACCLVCRISMFCQSHCTAAGSCSPSLRCPIGPAWPLPSPPTDLLGLIAARVDGPHCLETSHQNLQREQRENPHLFVCFYILPESKAQAGHTASLIYFSFSVIVSEYNDNEKK